MARILIADDDGTMRELLRRALESDGHTVVLSQDGLEALDHLTSGATFDVLFTDINMPGLDGLALAEKATARMPALSVVLMSGFADQLANSGRIRARRQASLAKPFTLEQARAAVKSVSG